MWLCLWITPVGGMLHLKHILLVLVIWWYIYAETSKEWRFKLLWNCKQTKKYANLPPLNLKTALYLVQSVYYFLFHIFVEWEKIRPRKNFVIVITDMFPNQVFHALFSTEQKWLHLGFEYVFLYSMLPKQV